MTKEQILAKLKADLELRGRSEETIKAYFSKARLFQDHYDKPADQMGEKEIIDYLHYLLTEKGISQTSVNTYNSGLRFLYVVTLDVCAVSCYMFFLPGLPKSDTKVSWLPLLRVRSWLYASSYCVCHFHVKLKPFQRLS